MKEKMLFTHSAQKWTESITKVMFLVMVILLNSGKITGQDSQQKHNPVVQPDSKKIWIMKAFIQDEKELWSSVWKWRDQQRYYWIPVVGLTALSILYDEPVYSEIKKYQCAHPWISGVSPVVTQGGLVVTGASISALFYLGGLTFKNDKAAQTGLMSAEALLHAGVVVTIGKVATGRQRPSFENGKDHWNWFPASLNMIRKGHLKSQYDAFPSGHTITIWSVATVIAKQYRDIPAIPAVCYTLATGVGLSRITEDTHWLSDVILGGALGYCIGSYVVNKHSGSHMTLFPSFGRNTLSMSATLRF